VGFGQSIGIDLGTASALLYIKGRGVVLNEPSVVAIDKNTKQVHGVGRAAQEMIGRTPGNIVAVRPLRDGVISDYKATEKMLSYFMQRAIKKSVFKPHVLICVPCGITEVLEKAVVDAAILAGAKTAELIEEPIAAAIGAGLDISKPFGNMIIDVGGGTCDIAVISLGGIVVGESIKTAGDAFDDAIIKSIRKNHKVIIGERTAENLKKTIAGVIDRENPLETEVKGRCQMNGLPRSVRITSEELTKALLVPCGYILDSVCSVLERTPPELVGDISTGGITMTGGGSLLYGLDMLISERTGLPVHVAKDAVSCVVKGTGKVLEAREKYPNITGVRLS
jgi:rod shape-determining protein MreB